MKPRHVVCILTTAAFALSACVNGPTRRTYTNDSGNESSPQGTRYEPRVGQTVGPRAELIRKAQGLYSRGDFRGAITLLNSVPDNRTRGAEQTEFYNLKGLVELALKSPASAEISFRKALVTNNRPDYAAYYQYNLASAFAEEGKKEDALRTLSAIDQGKMEAADLRKVQALKDKLQSPSLSQQNANPSVVSGPTPAPSATPTLAPYTGGVVAKRIGVLLPLSGKYETFGKKAQKAIELAFQSSDSSQAKEIELVAMDSGDSPFTQQAALKKLVEEQQVIAVIGPLLSKGIDALSELAEHYQVPLISLAQVQGLAAEHLFSCSMSTQDQAAKIIDYASRVRGFRKFAILAPSNKVGEETANFFWDEVLKHGGEVRAFETYDPDLTDFRGPVDRALGLHYTEVRAKELKDLAEKRAELKITKKTMKTQQYFSLPPIVDFDAVVIADEARTVGQIIPTFAYRDARNLSYLGITTWNSPQLVSRAGDQAEGALFPVVFNTLAPSQATKHFYDVYSTAYSANPSESDALAFDAANLVIEVMKDKPSSRDEFKSKLERVEQVEGATGKVSVKDHRCVRELALYTVKKGQFEVVRDAEK